MVSVGTIVWLSSELMFFAALFAMYFAIRAADYSMWEVHTEVLNIPRELLACRVVGAVVDDEHVELIIAQRLRLEAREQLPHLLMAVVGTDRHRDWRHRRRSSMWCHWGARYQVSSHLPPAA